MRTQVAAATRSDERPQGIVLPSQDDPVVRGATHAIGGPMGRRAITARAWWSPVRIVVLLAVLASALGAGIDTPCIGKAWSDSFEQFSRGCYTDMASLYWGRGIADGLVPYVDDPAQTGDDEVEYPVLTGVVMYLTNLPVSDSWSDANRGRAYFAVNAVLIALLLAATVWATAMTVRRRPWDAAMVALALGMILASTINWDLWAVTATALAMLAWARRYPVLAGLLLGLGASFKFYPVLLLGPLLILCLRAGRMRQWLLAAAGAAAMWVVANLPFMLARFDGWKHFYTFSSERGADYGSMWLVARDSWGFDPSIDRLNLLAGGALALLCLGIAALILFAPRRPRFHQVAFLVVVAFALTNKVYSPQFVVWLIPLAVLARPRWRDFLWWQAAEVIYFFAVWWYIIWVATPESGLPAKYYWAAIVVHVAATAAFSAFVVRDILRPECDPVRSSLGADDPGGGVLDEAPDQFAPLRSTRSSKIGRIPSVL